MANFQTKQGKALQAAFDPNHEPAIRVPVRPYPRDLFGRITPMDRTKKGVVYDSEMDERVIGVDGDKR